MRHCSGWAARREGTARGAVPGAVSVSGEVQRPGARQRRFSSPPGSFVLGMRLAGRREYFVPEATLP